MAHINFDQTIFKDIIIFACTSRMLNFDNCGKECFVLASGNNLNMNVNYANIAIG